MKSANFKMISGVDWNLDKVASYETKEAFLKASDQPYPAYNPGARDKILDVVWDEAQKAKAPKEQPKDEAQKAKVETKK